MRDGVRHYRVSVTAKDGIGEWGLRMGASNVFRKDDYFRAWLLTKLVNAERAVLHHPWLEAFIARTRKGQLDEVIKESLKPKDSVNPDKDAKMAGDAILNLREHTVKRLFQRHLSQMSDAMSTQQSESLVRNLVEGIEWICDYCNFETAIAALSIPTGAELTLCAKCKRESRGLHTRAGGRGGGTWFLWWK